MDGGRSARPPRWRPRRRPATIAVGEHSGAPRTRAGWLRTVGAARGPLAIRPVDAALTAAVVAAVELNVAVGGGYGAVALTAQAYLLGGVLAVPILLRHRWPLPVLLVCAVLLMTYYGVDRRNISPAPLLCLPLYDTAVAGYLAWAIAVPAVIMAAGLVAVGVGAHESLVTLAGGFLPSIVILMLAVMLGEVVRSRRALAAETAVRLRLAGEEREAEAARRVAEERLRIARELHDVVAHTMATISVQAGVAAHVLTDRPDAAAAALQAIRAASGDGLRELRAILTVLRRVDDIDPTHPAPGVAQLPALIDGTRRVGVSTTLQVTGRRCPLPTAVDLAAYRIVQEALTNVIKHAGPAAAASVALDYRDTELRIEVTDTGAGSVAAAGVGAGHPSPGRTSGPDMGPVRVVVGAPGAGHGLAGMRERAAAVGGTVAAGPAPAGGYRVVARLPIAGEAAATTAPAGVATGSARDSVAPTDPGTGGRP